MPLRNIIPLSPVTVRVAPFVIFLLLTAAQGWFNPASAYWFYLGKTLLALWMLLALRPLIAEMRWAFSWEAVLVGIGIFAIWVGISRGWALESNLLPPLEKFFHITPAKPAAPWNPNDQFGAGSPLAWLFIVTRIMGSTFVVPPLEEVFYRSFFYRYVAKVDFLSVPLNQFLPVPFMVTSVLFGLVHNQWLAGIICGAAYQWLVLRKNRLGDAMTAHAITNFLLGVWVVWRGAWQFW
jgi:CAAX prenyl protease-like protein